ncbi:MAG: family 43 glycosylhydrolase [Rikenellaceae bacterium]
MKKTIFGCALAALLSSCGCTDSASTKCCETSNKPTAEFPFMIPEEKPEFQLSAATERLYDQYGATSPQTNELFSVFYFSPIEGFDYDNGSGRISRRDPSRIVKVGDTFYMWYTLRRSVEAPAGAKGSTDVIPSVDWDLSDIGYATSKDGFTWVEQGVAVGRPEKPKVGWRSISTPEILVWKDKYYLYYQAFDVASGTIGDFCPVAMAEASSPDGPWTHIDKVVLPTGSEGSWDQNNIHDPLPVVMNGKIYMYYKADFNTGTYNSSPTHARSQGVAVGDSPYGPFVKSPLNPIMTSGHETQLFRFKEGVAAILTRDGMEHYTVQYAEDGVNFHVASIGGLMPDASGLYDPDAFTNSDYARGITWGICHINKYQKGSTHSLMFRFDCDLSLDTHVPKMKMNHVRPTYETFMKQRLDPKHKAKILKELGR